MADAEVQIPPNEPAPAEEGQANPIDQLRDWARNGMIGPEPNIPDPAIIEQRLRLHELGHRLAAQDDLERHLIAYLNVKCYGKKFDRSYLSYISTLLNEQLDAHRVFDYTIRERVFKTVVIAHRNDKLRQEPFWTAQVIECAREHNDAIEGEDDGTVWYKPWTWGMTHSLSASGNVGAPSPRRTSYRWVPFALSAAAIGALLMTGRRPIFKALSLLGVSTTTHQAVLQPVRLMLTDTSHVSFQPTSHNESVLATAISASLSAIHRLTQSVNTAIVSHPPPSGNSIMQFLTKWKVMGE
nr:hypothetical protein [Nelson wasp-associated virus 2]